MKDNKLKILFWDIETAQNLVAVFGLQYNDYIDPNNIIRERYIICASWKFEGDSKIHAVSILNDPKRYAADPYDDKHVVEVLHKVLSESDVIVHHNGDSFDKRWLDTRILFHGLTPLPPIVSIDTKKIAKARFYFNSNKLEYIANFLGLEQKKKTSSGLWLRILRGGKNAVAAIKEMVSYNKQDVVVLEDIYNKLLPFMPNALNRQLYLGGNGCPRCGSQKVQSRGTYYAQTRTYRRWQCMGKCKGWYRTLKTDKHSATTNRIL